MNNNRIFVDTWAWYALANRIDKDHKSAVENHKRLLEEKVQYVTSNFVFGETYTLILIRGKNHKAAIEFGERIMKMAEIGEIELIRISEKIENDAWNIAKKYDDKAFSYVDCTSFAIMKELEIKRAFTKDTHFEQIGFQIIG